MMATDTLDRVALEQRIESLSLEILTTGDVLQKLDLVQARCEARELLGEPGAGDLNHEI